MADIKKSLNSKQIIFLLFILLIPILFAIGASAVEGWAQVFDDSFISYRYAKNLAMGHGLVWNVGEAPTEGYTNILLVLFLAPFIKAGVDPLFVTRIASYLSALLMSAILYWTARKRFHASALGAGIIASLLLFLSQTRHLCLVGLETVIYALFLLASFVVGIEFLSSKTSKHSVVFSILIILTMLLRPEAALLYVAALLVYLIVARTESNLEVKPLFWGMVCILGLGLGYLLWKWFYFGSLLPNPFYIKAGTGGSFVKTSGAESVIGFYKEKWIYLLLLYPAWRICKRDQSASGKVGEISLILGGFFAGLYSLLFLHTDTLMDINGRFMYPLFPILLYALIPAFSKLMSKIEERLRYRTQPMMAAVLLLALLINSHDVLGVYDNFKVIMGPRSSEIDNSLMQKEYRIAKAMAEYPEIKKVRIAFGDAGVIAYFTESLWLDVVGLNDGYIAKTKDHASLVNYFFSRSPDLVINPGNKDFSWIRYGHGPLGNYASWLTDPRWDEYEYVGTSKTSGDIYDLQFFVKKSSLFRTDLVTFLRSKIVDGWYVPIPFEVGSYRPSSDRPAVWISVGE